MASPARMVAPVRRSIAVSVVSAVVLGLGLAVIPVTAGAAVVAPVQPGRAGAAANAAAANVLAAASTAHPGPARTALAMLEQRARLAARAAAVKSSASAVRKHHRHHPRRQRPAGDRSLRDRPRSRGEHDDDRRAGRNVRARWPRARQLRAGIPGLCRRGPVPDELVGRGQLAQRGRARAGGGEPGAPRSRHDLAAGAPGVPARRRGAIPAHARCARTGCSSAAAAAKTGKITGLVTGNGKPLRGICVEDIPCQRRHRLRRSDGKERQVHHSRHSTPGRYYVVFARLRLPGHGRTGSRRYTATTTTRSLPSAARAGQR